MKRSYIIFRFLLCVVFLFGATNGYSQLTITQDSLGGCGARTLYAHLIGDVPTPSGITADDGWSGTFPIGFNYTFYGVTHTQCIIGSNGCLGFDLSYAGGYNTWPISATLLSTTSSDIHDLIAGPWCDIYIPAGGTITWSLDGVAPNRKFAVTYCHDAMYSCTTQWITTQIIIYETTNIAEVHIAHHTFCTWNGGYAVCGVKDVTGSFATVAPGRDYPANWNAIDEAWRFTPTSATSYAVSSIPYAPIPFSSSLIYWYDSATGAFLGTGDSLSVSPSGPTTYIAAALGCADTTFAYTHVTGGGPHIRSLSSTTPTTCSICNGTLTLHGVAPGHTDSLYYSIGGVPQPVIVTTAASDSTITLTGLCTGIYSDIYIRVMGCVSNIVGPDTLSTPPIFITHTSYTNPTVCGACNGTITLYGLPPHEIDSIFYTFNGVPHAVFIDSSSGFDSAMIISNLCSGVYTNIYVKVNNCVTNIVGPITLVSPTLAISGESSTNPTVCGKCDGTITLRGLYPYQAVSVAYTRNTFSMPAYTGIVAGDSTFTMTGMCAGMYDGIVATIGLCSAPGTPLVLIDPSITADFDTSIHLGCFGDTVILNNLSTPAGYVAYWNFGDGTPIDSTSTSPVHVYADQSTYTGSYNITLVYSTYYTCYDTLTLPITFDHQINPILTIFPNPACLGSPITFSNTSTATLGIKSTLMDFGNGVTDTSLSPVYTYPNAGIYTTLLYVNDNLGCQAVAAGVAKVVSITATTAVHDTSVCLTDSMRLYTTVVITPTGIDDAVSYNWTPANNLGDATAAEPRFMGIGDFHYTFTATTNTLGCTSSDTETIHSYPPITLINLTANSTIHIGASIQLNADGATFYTWTPNDGSLNNTNINDPIATPTDSTVYTVYGMSEFGCLDSATIIVGLDYVEPDCVPSGFTPNGDGLNDYFHVVNLRHQRLVDMRVYNRWGVEVFHTINPEIGWDGTYEGVPQDMGVYTYVIILAHSDGTEHEITGTVTLLR